MTKQSVHSVTLVEGENLSCKYQLIASFPATLVSVYKMWGRGCKQDHMAPEHRTQLNLDSLCCRMPVKSNRTRASWVWNSAS